MTNDNSYAPRMKFLGLSALFVVIAVLHATLPVHAVGLSRPDVVVPDSPFIEAVRSGDMDEVNAAIVRGQSVDLRDKNGAPAIFVALQFSQTDMFKFLVEQGARVEVKDRQGDTLLSLLAGTKLYEVTSIVLKAGADPDRPGANREPPLIIASRNGDAEMVQLLLDYNADYEATDLTGRTALNIARERRFSHVVNALEAAGAR